MLGPIIAAGANLAGGLLGLNAQKDAAAAQERMAAQNIALQKEFAQSGIQWKVADAKAAGVHPLYALGANTTSFSPVSIGSPSGNPLGDGISRAGQDLSRAMAATSNSTTRLVSGLTVERSMLENDLLRVQIAKAKQQIGPPVPTAHPSALDALFSGQGDAQKGMTISDLIKFKPHEVTPTAYGQKYAEPGPMPEVGYTRSPSGGYMVTPSKDYKDRAEDFGPLGWQWWIKHQLLPNIGLNHTPPPSVQLKDDEQWYYHPYQEYRIKKKGSWGW